MRLNKGWRLAIAGAAGALLLGGAATAAFASIPDSSGVIHACYQSPPPTGGANLQVIDSDNGGKCSGGHVEITWNQTGPQGPIGPQGAPGPAGPSTAGPGGLSVEYVSSDSVVECTQKMDDRGTYGCPNPPPGTPINWASQVGCPPDHPYVLGGGGYDAEGAQLGIDSPVANSLGDTYGSGVNFPPYNTSDPGLATAEVGSSANGWLLTTSGSQIGDQVLVWAICAQ